MTQSKWVSLIKEVTEDVTGTSMTKAQSVEIASRLGDAQKEALQSGDKIVSIPGVSLSLVKRAARQGRNPQTGEPLSIPARVGCRAKITAEGKKIYNS